MARGKLWFKRGTVFGAVVDSSGQTVWSDNTGSPGWRSMFASVVETTKAFQRVERLGQSFKPWAQVVDEAAEL